MGLTLFAFGLIVLKSIRPPVVTECHFCPENFPDCPHRKAWRSHPAAHRARHRGVDRLPAAARQVAGRVRRRARAALRRAGAVQLRALIERAEARPRRPYAPPPQPAPEVVKRIDYDAHGKLRFRPEYALFADGPGVYPVTFQFLGGFFPKIGAHARGRGRQGARDPLLARLLHRHRRQPGARAAAGHQRLRRDSGSRRAGCRATGASGSPGPPSWAPPTSAPWASSARSACRPAAWR